MPERFRFSFQQPPFRFLIRQMFSEESFVTDVMRLAAIDEKQRLQVQKEIESQVFADLATLNGALQSAGVPDADDVASTLHRLSAMVRESQTTKDSAREAFVVALSSSTVEEGQRAAIASAFEELCLRPASLDLQQKAQRLANATGCSVEEFDIVCDIRPVFDIDGEKIVGAIPYFTLRVEYDDGESQKIDLHLSNHQIDRLKEVVDRAVRKRGSLDQAIASVEGWRSPRIS